MKLLNTCVYLLCVSQITCVSGELPIFKWVCVAKQCIKAKVNPQRDVNVFNLEQCMMFCDEYGVLWPQPNGLMIMGNQFLKIDFKKFTFNYPVPGASNDLLKAAIERFKKMVNTTILPVNATPNPGNAVNVNLINRHAQIKELSLETDESYKLSMSPNEESTLVVDISADTFFGLRHGLETLSQLILYDENTNNMLIVQAMNIIDRPVYPYRGLLLDTARNYFSVKSIKAMIDAMAVVKLNTFHWHITDTQSFPFVSERRPELSKYGAYSPSKVYTKSMIRDIVEYSAVRGVRVLPEMDAPAHVGEGFPEELLTCFKIQPWNYFCIEPPCGQFNPIKEQVYDYLEDIYKDMAEAFKSDMFHMGGDGVSEKCWITNYKINQFMRDNGWNDSKAYLKLWSHFQTTAQQRVYKAFRWKIPIILWSSKLTKVEDLEKHLPKDEYIFQISAKKNDPKIKSLLKKGYNIIMTLQDVHSLDCGFGFWVEKAKTLCKYNSWQEIYDLSPSVNSSEYAHLILGAEAAMWSQQVDEVTMESRVWPRAAALAERLWADPLNSPQDAEARLHNIRERLVRMGVKADPFRPEWCSQYEGQCPLRKGPSSYALKSYQQHQCIVFLGACFVVQYLGSKII